MNISISYSEILNFVEKKFKVRPMLQKKTASALVISYKPAALLPTMSVDIAVDGIDGDAVLPPHATILMSTPQQRRRIMSFLIYPP